MWTKIDFDFKLWIQTSNLKMVNILTKSFQLNLIGGNKCLQQIKTNENNRNWWPPKMSECSCWPRIMKTLPKKKSIKLKFNIRSHRYGNLLLTNIKLMQNVEIEWPRFQKKFDIKIEWENVPMLMHINLLAVCNLSWFFFRFGIGNINLLCAIYTWNLFFIDFIFCNVVALCCHDDVRMEANRWKRREKKFKYVWC